MRSHQRDISTSSCESSRDAVPTGTSGEPWEPPSPGGGHTQQPLRRRAPKPHTTTGKAIVHPSPPAATTRSTAPLPHAAGSPNSACSSSSTPVTKTPTHWPDKTVPRLFLPLNGATSATDSTPAASTPSQRARGAISCELTNGGVSSTPFNGSHDAALPAARAPYEVLSAYPRLTHLPRGLP